MATQSGFHAKAYMRKHVVDMDEPEGLDASDIAASAHEQLLSAVGTCMTVGFGGRNPPVQVRRRGGDRR